ncbi:hypothetical protein ACVIHF_008488 [Bradyrhizobium sp. USDA 4506]
MILVAELVSIHRSPAKDYAAKKYISFMTPVW